MSRHSFNPTEIIFSATDACNLLCPHCFVSRTPAKLSPDAAIAFLKSCKDSPASQIEKVGFSGGEPFLYMDFLCAVIKAAVDLDFMFDQIMTNGDWWQNYEDLIQKLQRIYDAGYDGKIGLSWDSFHGQNRERMEDFADAVHSVFGDESLNLQSVIPFAPVKNHEKAETDSKNPPETYKIDGVPLYQLPQSFPGDDNRIWQAKKWFKEDYCEGPGQILYIHSNGNIAPCCGFANENPSLFIGTISDTFEKVMENAADNKMIKICYEIGLSKYKKQVKKLLHAKGLKFSGKCDDMCGFCDFVMKLKTQ